MVTEIKARDSRCEKCSRFSHCNNNELVCIEKFWEVKQLLEDSEYANNCLNGRFLNQTNNCNFYEKEYNKYKQIIDEIEDICKNGRLDECSLILKIISELKGEK